MMSEIDTSTPTVAEAALYWQWGGHMWQAPERFDRMIAKVRADALREWSDFQQSALDVSGHVLDSDEWSTARAWIGDARAYALRIEGEAWPIETRAMQSTKRSSSIPTEGCETRTSSVAD